MAEYIDREELVRQIICSMGEFIGAPDDVQKHDEQCNYAINVIEDAPAADVAPVVHGRWNIMEGEEMRRVCSKCGWDVPEYGKFYTYCPNCGCRMDGGDNDAAD